MNRYAVHISTCSHGSSPEAPNDTVYGFKRKIYVGMFFVGSKKACENWVDKWKSTNSHMVKNCGLSFEINDMEENKGASHG